MTAGKWTVLTLIIHMFTLGLMAQAGIAASPAPDSVVWSPLYEPGSGGWITSVQASSLDPSRVLMGGDMLGIGLSVDSGSTWESTSGLPSWEIGEFTFHPTDIKTVWAGTMSGPAVSSDSGRTWTISRKGFPGMDGGMYSAPIQKVLFDPNNSSHLIAVGGSYRRWASPGKPAWGAIWESTDSGNNWKKVSTAPNRTSPGNIVSAGFAAGSSKILYASIDNKGVFASEDGGLTWTPRNDGLPTVDTNRLAIHPSDPGTLWVATNCYKTATGNQWMPGGIFKSTDAGIHWVPADQGLPKQKASDPNQAPKFQSVSVNPKDPNLLITSNTSWNNPAVFISRDGGTTWKSIKRTKTTVPEGIGYASGFSFTVTEFHPAYTDTAFIAGSEFCLRTTDTGETWKDVTAFKVPDAQGWRGTGYSGLCAVNYRFDPYHQGRSAVLAMDHGNFWFSTDNLGSWSWGGKDFPTWGGASDAAFTKGDTIYVTCGQFGNNEGILRSKDAGKTWKVLAGSAMGLPERWSQAQPVGIHAHPDNPDKVWATVGGKLYASSDSGEHWQQVAGGSGLGYIEGDPFNPGSFYITGGDGVYYSREGGVPKLIPGGPIPTTRISADPNTPGRIYATSWRSSEPKGGVWRLDSGKWTRISKDSYICNIAVNPKDPMRLAAIAQDHPYHDRSYGTGVYLSDDGGATWTMSNNGLAMLRGEAIAFDPFDPGRIIAGTMGRGYFIARWPMAGNPR